MSRQPEPAADKSRRRRSRRVVLSVPVVVSGQSCGRPFAEETKTLVVNAHGALILLSAPTELDAVLQISSRTHPEPQPCRVVYLGAPAEGQTQIGVEFTEPAPHFWNIAFPPEDWFPSSSENPAAPPIPAEP